MVVVMILALLGVLAVNIYKRYLLKAKTSEAMTMLSHIKAKQEAYHAEHYRYAHFTAYHPLVIKRDEKVDFTPFPDQWKQLGIQPSTKAVYFQYTTISDQGGAAPPSGVFNPVPSAWFIATAQAKFDSSDVDTTFEIASDRDTVWKKDRFGNSGPP
jgi:Tfp pilus assembly protein PilE